MSMDREKLSARKKQPGHFQVYLESENAFVRFLGRSLNPALFEIGEKPRELLHILPNPGIEGAQDAYGIIPDALVTCTATGRKLYFEVKRQNKGGNADERACKHHTVQFQSHLRTVTGYGYHAMVTILCEELANYPKYLAKHPYFFEPDSYFCWKDYNDVRDLRVFLERVVRKTIVDDKDAIVLVDQAED